MAWKQKVRLVEGHLHAPCLTGCQPVVRGARLYAVLMPSVRTSGVLISACRTWEDAL